MNETHEITIRFLMDDMDRTPEYSAEILLMLLDEAKLGYYVDEVVSAERI